MIHYMRIVEPLVQTAQAKMRATKTTRLHASAVDGTLSRQCPNRYYQASVRTGKNHAPPPLSPAVCPTMTTCAAWHDACHSDVRKRCTHAPMIRDVSAVGRRYYA
jgi:hypothetical protein